MLCNAHQPTHQHRQLAPLGLEKAKPRGTRGSRRARHCWQGGRQYGLDWNRERPCTGLVQPVLLRSYWPISSRRAFRSYLRRL